MMLFWIKTISGSATVLFIMLSMYFHVFSAARNFSRWWEIIFLGLATASFLIFQGALHKWG